MKPDDIGSGVFVNMLTVDTGRLVLLEVPKRIPLDANLETFKEWAASLKLKFYTWAVL